MEMGEKNPGVRRVQHYLTSEADMKQQRLKRAQPLEGAKAASNL